MKQQPQLQLKAGKRKKTRMRKGRQFQEQAYREEASMRPLFLTLKLSPTGTGRAEAGGMRTQASGWCVVRVRMSLPLSQHLSSLGPASSGCRAERSHSWIPWVFLPRMRRNSLWLQLIKQTDRNSLPKSHFAYP